MLLSVRAHVSERGKQVRRIRLVKKVLSCRNSVVNGWSFSTTLLSQLFDEIDVTKDGIITYTRYFIFLKDYFGSKSVSNEQVNV